MKYHININISNFQIKASLCSEVPFVVVGMEIEKRTEKFDELMPMPENEAKKRAHLQGANTYVECSERTGVSSKFIYLFVFFLF